MKHSQTSARTPKINEFYDTIRSHGEKKTEEDQKSIDEIRIIGKEILQEKNKQQLAESNIVYEEICSNGYRSSSLQTSQWKGVNLYDKYKYQNKRKTEKKIISRAEQVANVITSIPQKSWKNPKYDYTKSRYANKSGVNVLNYEKRVDKKVKQLKRDEQQRKNNEIQHSKIIKGKANFNNVIKRGEEMNQKKNQKVQLLRNKKIIKQMEGVTFRPQLVSKQSRSLEKTFEKRFQKSLTLRHSRQKNLILSTALLHNFTPKLNENIGIQSPTKKIWEQSIKNEELIQDKCQESQKKEKQIVEEQKVSQQITRVTLRNQSQMQFLMNE